jgi:hypothetical protein
MRVLSFLCVSTFSVVLAQISTANVTMEAALNIRGDNSYGAPIPPWQANTRPGWYYGRPQGAPHGLPSFVDQVH